MNNKRGQFYLIAAVVVVALVLAYIAISNSISKSSFRELEKPQEDLKIESSNVLDYVLYKNLDEAQRNEKIEDFAKTYSNYSSAENFYYIYGDSSSIRVSAYRKKSSSGIYVNAAGSNEEMEIPLKIFTTQNFIPTLDEVTLTIEGNEHSFKIEQGQNFYFIISQENEGEEYIFTGSAIKDE